jgi:predicted kinase
VPFTGLWLDARARRTLVGRVQGRRGDPSDADAAVVRQQFADGVGDVAWHASTPTPTPLTMTAEARGVVERAASLAQGTSTGGTESRPARRSSSA